MAGFQISPPNAPLVDSSGTVMPEWYRFFVAIQRRIGSTFNPFDEAALQPVLNNTDLAVGIDAIAQAVGLLPPVVEFPAAPATSRAKLRFVAP